MQSLIQVFIELLVAAVITLVCVCVQTLANIALLYWVLRTFEQIDRKFSLVWRVSIVVRLIFAFIGIHLSQVGIWAFSYLLLGCFSSTEEAIYFSLASFSTTETGDSALPSNWRLLGPFEGLAGIIAFGLSIGFIFTVINRLQASRIRQRQESHSGAGE